MIRSILLLVYSLFVLGMQVFSQTYFAELGLSFLPYHGALLLFLLLLACRKFPYRRYKSSLSMITIGLIASISANIPWIQFYQNMPLDTQKGFNQHTAQEHKQLGISFLFANLLKDNTNYEQLQKAIQRQNPDVLLLVEYTAHHHEALKKYIQKNYPYVNRSIGTQEVIGGIVFSKYPLEDFAPKIHQGRWRYGYVAINKQEKDYYFYLVHTSAPVSYEYFQNRNKQIQTFAESFTEHDAKRLPTDKVIIVGDFNVSPRSPVFQKFNQQIQKSMRHFSRYT